MLAPGARVGHDLRITPNLAPRPAVRRLMITANSSRKPTNDWNQVVETPDRIRPVYDMPSTIAASSAPMMLPRPPISEPPPTTATTIAVSARSEPWVGVAEPKEPNWMMPVNAARSEDRRKQPTLTRADRHAHRARGAAVAAAREDPVADGGHAQHRRRGSMAMPISQRIETEILLWPISAAPSQLITGELPKYEIG